MNFGGRTAVVTGGASGIGLATSVALAEAGARVLIGDINAEAGEAAAQRLAARGRDAAFLPLDVTDDAAVGRFAAAVGERAAQVDILVNVAGWSHIERFMNTEPALWRRLVDLNYMGVLSVTHAFLGPMIERAAGKIVNVSSDAGRVGSSGEAVYSGAKGAVVAFTKALARETARSGINVNCVCPGPTDTPLLASIPEKQREALMRVIPFRRFAKPEEVADAVLFFASSRADYITGQVLSVSGGLTMVD